MLSRGFHTQPEPQSNLRAFPDSVTILRRYILSEVLLATIGAMLFFCVILVGGNVLRDLAARLAEGRLSLTMFFQLFGLLIPYIFSFSLPLGFLAGVLIGLGRLSSNREIIAMKATGSSLWDISLPILILAALGSILAGFTNNYVAPTARATYKTLLVEALREDPLRFFETGVLSREFPGYIFFIQENDHGRLKGFWLWELDSEDRPSFFIRADYGEIRYEREKDALILTLRNGLAEQWPRAEKQGGLMEGATVFFEEFPVELPLSYSLGAAKVEKTMSQLTLSEMLQMLRGTRPLPDRAANNPERYLRKLKVEISNNFSLAASILALATIGIPLAIRTGRKETYANAMLALALGLVYYFFVSMISSLDIPSRFAPELLIWLPNIAVIGIGIALMRRVYLH